MLKIEYTIHPCWKGYNWFIKSRPLSSFCLWNIRIHFFTHKRTLFCKTKFKKQIYKRSEFSRLKINYWKRLDLTTLDSPWQQKIWWKVILDEGEHIKNATTRRDMTGPNQKLNNQRSFFHFGFVFEKTQSGKSHDYLDAIVFGKLCFQNVFRPR